MFHCGLVVSYNGPTAHHKIPQTIQDTIPQVLSVWLRWTLSPVNPCMDDCSIAREVGERYFLCDAFEYQHREGVCVKTCSCVDVIVFDELCGWIPDIFLHWICVWVFGDFLHNPHCSKVANQWFALTSVWSACSSSDVNVKFTSSDISTFFCAPSVHKLS